MATRNPGSTHQLRLVVLSTHYLQGALAPSQVVGNGISEPSTLLAYHICLAPGSPSRLSFECFFPKRSLLLVRVLPTKSRCMSFYGRLLQGISPETYEGFMVNNLACRWLKHLFFMVSGANGLYTLSTEPYMMFDVRPSNHIPINHPFKKPRPSCRVALNVQGYLMFKVWHKHHLPQPNLKVEKKETSLISLQPPPHC